VHRALLLSAAVLLAGCSSTAGGSTPERPSPSRSGGVPLLGLADLPAGWSTRAVAADAAASPGVCGRPRPSGGVRSSAVFERGTSEQLAESVLTFPTAAAAQAAFALELAARHSCTAYDNDGVTLTLRVLPLQPVAPQQISFAGTTTVSGRAFEVDAAVLLTGTSLVGITEQGLAPLTPGLLPSTLARATQLVQA